jgi:ribonuclease HI
MSSISCYIPEYKNFIYGLAVFAYHYHENNDKYRQIAHDTILKINELEEPIYVYTDGACTNNGKANAKAGLGIYFSENDNRNLGEKVSSEYKQTNNVAELLAILKALQILEKEIEFGRKIMVYTDSEYSINVATGRMKASKNTDIINKIKSMLRNNVKFVHINSHKDRKLWPEAEKIHYFGNFKADEYATNAIKN